MEGRTECRVVIIERVMKAASLTVVWLPIAMDNLLFLTWSGHESVSSVSRLRLPARSAGAESQSYFVYSRRAA